MLKETLYRHFISGQIVMPLLKYSAVGQAKRAEQDRMLSGRLAHQLAMLAAGGSYWCLQP